MTYTKFKHRCTSCYRDLSTLLVNNFRLSNNHIEHLLKQSRASRMLAMLRTVADHIATRKNFENFKLRITRLRLDEGAADGFQ